MTCGESVKPVTSTSAERTTSRRLFASTTPGATSGWARLGERFYTVKGIPRRIGHNGCAIVPKPTNP